MESKHSGGMPRLESEPSDSERKHRNIEITGPSQTFLDASPDPIVIYNLAGKVQYLNPAFSGTFGWTLDELQGQSIDFVPKECWPATKKAIERMLSGQQIQLFESKRLTKDGRTLDVQLSTALYYDQDNTPAGNIVILRDVTRIKRVEEELTKTKENLENLVKIKTVDLSRANSTLKQEIKERKRIEAALRENEQKYKELVNSLPQVVFEFDEYGNIEFVNQNALKLFGYTEDELKQGLNALDMVAEKDRERVVDDIQQIMQGGKVVGREYTAVRKDGSTFPISAHAERVLRHNTPWGARGILIDLTKIKKYEEALLLSEERYRTLFESTIDALFLLKEDQIVACNPSSLAMFGYTNKQLIGSHPFDFSPAIQSDGRDSEEKAKEKISACLDGKPQFFEWQHQRSDGTVFDAEVSLNAVHLKSGRYLFATVHDISARKKAENEIRSSKEFLDSILNRLDDPFFVKDQKHRWIILNDNACKVMGLPREELIGKSDHDLFPKEQADVFLEKDELVLQTGETNLNEEEITWNGKIHTIATKKSLYTDSVTGEKFIVGTIRDITEQKRIENSLRQSEEKLRNITSAAQDAIIMMDHLGCISYWNPAAEKIFGYSVQEAIGQGLHQLLAPARYHQKFFDSYKDFQKDGSGSCIGKLIELEGLNKNGTEFPIELSLSAIQVDQKWSAIGIVRDISERKAAEDEKKALEAQLHQAHRLEAIGTLAGGIAHDFNNILSAIIGYTELAMTEKEPGDALQYNLQSILNAGFRARDLVKQILTFSRQAELEKQPMKIKLIVKETLTLLRATLPTTINIQNKLISDASVIADPTQIHQILMNLCTNASHAMNDKGGTLDISLTDIEIGPDKDVRFLDLESGNYIELSVTDTGYGINPKIINRIFDPFFTTKPKGEGTGMGLAVVHGIVKGHGGSIKVDSIPGQGTTFSVYLPSDKKRKTETIERESASPTGTEHILFVDDEKSLVDLGQQLLKQLGYQVTVRTSSIEALELFRNKPDTFDLVLTDMTMPNMTGLQLSNELQKIRPDIPIIICTGYSNLISEEIIKAMDIRRFIMKPFSLSELSKTIREILDNQ